MTRPTEIQHVADSGASFIRPLLATSDYCEYVSRMPTPCEPSCFQQSQLTATWRVKTGDRPPSLQHLQYLEVARRHKAGTARVGTGMCVDSHERANDMI